TRLSALGGRCLGRSATGTAQQGGRESNPLRAFWRRTALPGAPPCEMWSHKSRELASLFQSVCKLRAVGRGHRASSGGRTRATAWAGREAALPSWTRYRQWIHAGVEPAPLRRERSVLPLSQ